MDQKMIAEIAHQVVRQELLQNAQFYLLVLALMIVGGAIGAFMGEYLRGRGKAYATKVDFELLTEQLKRNTELTETIKRDISHDDWQQREYKTIRRGKLEELVRALRACLIWLDRHRRIEVSKEAGELGQECIHDAQVIASLYFPELDLVPFTTAYGQVKFWQIRKAGEASILKLDGDALNRSTATTQVQVEAIAAKLTAHQSKYKNHLDGVSNEYQATMMPLHIALMDLQNQAAKLMAETIRRP